MKNFALQLFFLWGAVLGPVIAYGPRAVAEEMSYWYAYVLEGKALESSVGYSPIVALGCADRQAGGKRCSLKQFLDYIYAPQVDHNGNPKHAATPDGPNPNPQRTLNGKMPTCPKSLLGSTMPAIEMALGDFWSARRMVTRPIADLSALVDQFHDQTMVTKLLAKAREANKAAYMMRLMDYEKYRISKGSLASVLGEGKTVKTKRLDTGIRGYTFDALDAQATLNANEGLTQGELEEAAIKVRDLPSNRNHWVALKAGQVALASGHCEIPAGADITLR
ncbi:hypothetical protein N7516_008671 [Penicillium verrucosum]|uniref:uncharacterized protein n=1 Tax=Penicillium verrucosum TaxID=60171 RepID=UPI00254595F0|nr:uncharacterized protein N7516_008671 [Penicillium verrucosum]KAJ5926898.1 hypothetical protein N7516_008671 [Penicillium verrucosum]